MKIIKLIILSASFYYASIFSASRYDLISCDGHHVIHTVCFESWKNTCLHKEPPVVPSCPTCRRLDMKPIACLDVNKITGECLVCLETLKKPEVMDLSSIDLVPTAPPLISPLLRRLPEEYFERYRNLQARIRECRDPVCKKVLLARAKLMQAEQFRYIKNK